MQKSKSWPISLRMISATLFGVAHELVNELENELVNEDFCPVPIRELKISEEIRCHNGVSSSNVRPAFGSVRGVA